MRRWSAGVSSSASMRCTLSSSCHGRHRIGKSARCANLLTKNCDIEALASSQPLRHSQGVPCRERGQHGTHDHHEGITALIRTLRSSWFFAVLAVALAGCNGGFLQSSAPESAGTGASAADLAFYRSVLDKVHQSYVDPLPDSKLVDNSL